MTTKDKPWLEEPDEKRWIHKDTGLRCIILRNPRAGFLCGYVGVEASSPLFGISYDILPVEVHGGLTFEGAFTGEPKNMWWFGFDCGHCYDVSPYKSIPLSLADKQTYKDMSYVKDQTEKLASQIKQLESNWNDQSPS